MPEVRLIDANALKNSFDSAYTVFGQCVYAKGIVDSQPTIEAEPVRHGRWIQRRNGEYYCTNCGREERFIFQKNFCPRCGARMDADDTNVSDIGCSENDT